MVFLSHFDMIRCLMILDKKKLLIFIKDILDLGIS